jgi:hypothetical protein
LTNSRGREDNGKNEREKARKKKRKPDKTLTEGK